MEASESLNPEPAPAAPADPKESVAPEAAQPAPQAPVNAPEPTPVPEPAPADPVRVDNQSRRSDDDVLEGHFATVINGEHKGQVGAFVSVATYGDDGYPDSVLIRFRDHNYTTDLAPVAYSDIRPADPYRGGR